MNKPEQTVFNQFMHRVLRYFGLIDEDPLRVYELDSTTTYVGYAQSTGTANTEAKWKIKKIVESAPGAYPNTTTITYVNGSKAYDQIWNPPFTNYNFI